MPTLSSGRRAKAIWVVTVCASAAILGVFVFRVQQHIAPLLLVPLLAGGALGYVGWKSGQSCAVVPGRWLWGVLLMAVLALTLAQHLSAWRHYRAALEQSRRAHPELQLVEAGAGEMRPVSLADYLRLETSHGRQIGKQRLSAGWTWASWYFDALVTLLVAIGTFRFFERRDSGAAVTGSQP